MIAPPLGRRPARSTRVRVGPYADRSEADRVRDRLDTEEQFEPWVVRP